MRKKRLLAKAGVLCLLVLLGMSAFSQNSVITGKITDSAGTPLAGATVAVPGTSRGTTTDAKGVYHLTITPGVKTLLISAVGYTPRQVSIGSSGLVILSAANSSLNEVVVIGYGTARKKDLTGSIAVVSEKDFQKGAITTPDQMIAGKVAGVSVISNSGSPGAGSTIRIRGGTSINASNDPLIVIDGVPLSNNGISGVANPLSMINSDDIESFTILKDASATAIYGSRAANGVIIITTKKGRGAGLEMTFNTVNSVATIAKEVSVLNGDQMRSVVKANGTAAQIALLGNSNTNWQNQIFHSAFGTTNDLSISGGIKNLPYRVSLGYQNQDGILRTDNLQKTSVSIALDPVLLDNHLRIDINVKGSIENTRFANQGAIGAAIGFDPTQPVYSKTKSNRFGGYFEWVDANGNLLSNIPYNPLGELYENINKSSPERSIGNIQVDYNFPFLPELHVKVNAGYDVSLGKGTTFVPDSAASNYNVANPGTLGGSNNKYKQTTNNTVLEYYLNYVKDFKSIKSHLDAIAGYSYNDFQTTNYEYGNYSATGHEINTGDSTAKFDKPQNVIISFLARAAYSFDNRFYLTGSIRDDGSSRFGPYGVGTSFSTIGKGNKWGLFPSGAFKWKISNESFLKNSRVVSDLEVRVGYGVTGQQDGITDYGYLTTYALAAQNAAYQFGNQYIQGYRPSGYDGNLTWEQTATTNLGVDYGFLNNRITGSVDFYLKKTSHLLESLPQGAGTNFSAYVLENVGNLENKGVEFNIDATPVQTRDLSWQVAFNIAYNKSRITNLTVLPDDPTFPGVPWDQINGTGAQGFAQIQAVGYAKNTFNLYQQIYDQKTGLPIEGLFNDVNRDGIINSSDAVKGRHSDPDVFLGFSTNVSYRKWTAGFVVRASFDNYVYDQFLATDGSLSNVLGGSVISNVSTDYLKTHFLGNTTTQFLSDYYLYNASFLKMDNLNVGYNFGRVFNNRSTLRGSIIVQNVFVITKYPGIDPEISSGIDGNTYPRPRTYSLGLNLRF
ncbi:MAG TPA: SusC/RagA family TonB-linked outer membrane protein [Puia sp.]|jgi:iron complex outermembrane receptor protein|nr:SusC/RagA family TonB-linked outer membrane protein [Puia sp.]